MDKEQEVLKRCPFCGSEATLERVPETMIADCTDAVVRCSNCGALGPPILYERDTGQDDPHPEAIAAWNRRSSDEQAEVVQFHVTDEKNGIDYTAHARSRAPAVAAGGVTEAMVEAAMAYMRDGPFVCPEHPGNLRFYATNILTAALAVGDEGIREGDDGH